MPARFLRAASALFARAADRISSEPLPGTLVVPMRLVEHLRYGENPHQIAALYRTPRPVEGPSVVTARRMQGKDLSYNNVLDADAALSCVLEFEEPAAVIVKHGSPCGAAVGNDIGHAYARAYACDPVSAYGGVVAVNRELDGPTAAQIASIFVDVVIAPAIHSDAVLILAKKPNIRVLITGPAAMQSLTRTVRSIAGGFLVETPDDTVFSDDHRVVTKRGPTQAETDDMVFAFTVAKYVRSNAIVFAKDGTTLGIGAGQMSRVYSARLAVMKAADAGLDLKESVMASDAFMPFPDTVEVARDAGASAVIQPGGSLKDQAAIEAADQAGMTMVFTGVRHFRH